MTDSPPPNPGAHLLRGIFLGAGLMFVAALPALYLTYRHGKARGIESERRRAFAKEGIVCPADPTMREAPLEAKPDAPAANTETATAKEAPRAARSAIALTVMDCVRITWPMEILAKSDAVDHPHVRLREGANRFARPGRGVCEFVFRTKKDATLALYLHCRGRDECSNSIFCRINGGSLTYIPFGEHHAEWCWRPAYRRFQLKAGLHRLTLHACEDGILFDRIVLSTAPLPITGTKSPVLDAIQRKAPPLFESFPVVSPSLPAIGPVTAAAMPTDSLVIGRGHTNTLSIHLRLNGKDPVKGTVRVRSRRGRIDQTHPFDLSPNARTRLLTLPLAFKPHNAYLIPVGVEVFVGETRILYERVDFINPLTWAFLGPFPDPKSTGLDLALPPDADIGMLHKRPAYAGMEWRIVADGSCYNALGVVDLNQVFGLPTLPRTGRKPPKANPMIAYAVTCVPSFPNDHQSLAYGADDCVQVWVNGKPLLRVDANVPLELSRQVVGTRTGFGRNTFVFKVAQTTSYWQLLFEPDCHTPYGLRDFLVPLPIKKW